MINMPNITLGGVKRFFGGVEKPAEARKVPKLVIAINAVDKIEPGDWNTKLNWPSPEQERNIDRRCETLARQFARSTGIPKDQIAYYSALQYYQVDDVLAAMIRATKDGFVWGSRRFKPKSTFDKIDDADVLAEISRVRGANPLKYRHIGANPMDIIMEMMKSKLSKEDFQKVSSGVDSALAKEPKVALLGQTGVGKTTTICALLGVDPGEAVAKGLISHVKQGTREETHYHLSTPQKGAIEVIDLPGYGATVKDDAKYQEIYRAVIPQCDVIVIVVDATNRATAQDELMVQRILKYINN